MLMAVLLAMKEAIYICSLQRKGVTASQITPGQYKFSILEKKKNIQYLDADKNSCGTSKLTHHLAAKIEIQIREVPGTPW